ncbi:hypothetical protein [Streptomyces sp. NPDC008092]|uniref:SbtR family transcriptional regulator n=1 Tax=Streptomyces sp. NPDC008092 TaxID=3364808 RepID=UPI0036E862B8
MLPYLEALIRRAQDSGQLRAEVTASDIPVMQQMLVAAQSTQGRRPDIWRRCIEILLNGLRRRPDDLPLTTPGLSDELVEQVMGLVRPAPARD